jgi:kumamolisin
MIVQTVFAAALVVGASAPSAPERAAVNAHLARLSQDAVTLGRTDAAAPVAVLVGLEWRNGAALERFVHDVADPQSPQYQRFLSAREFDRRFAPRTAQIAALNRYLRRAGLRLVHISRSRRFVRAIGSAAQVETAFGTELLDVLDAGRRRTITRTAPALPDALAAAVVSVGSDVELRVPRGVLRPAVDLPLDPHAVASLYGFDELYAAGLSGATTRESTIAIASAFAHDPADLQAFWNQAGIARTAADVELIAVAGGTAPQPSASDRLETTLDVEWATAMAPGARVLVYAGNDASASTFLAVYDRIVSDNRAAVLSTSWGRCELDYPDVYLSQMHAVLSRAAVQGITVIAATGDQGARACSGQSGPSVSFPASHPYVLAIGGTSLRSDGGAVQETAWSGSGGGLSARYAAPDWQMLNSPQRALADVALNADPNSGYLVYNGGNWGVFGGTSLGAPIWAALVALANQARTSANRPPLGLAAPLLCEAALARTGDPPFVDIDSGSNGAFTAGPGFDLPTGWGTPRTAALVRMLRDWTPAPDANGGTPDAIALAPGPAAGSTSARLRFKRRCLTTSIDLQLRKLAPGSYRVEIDGVLAATFSPDQRGGAILMVPGVDVRGHVLTISDATGAELFHSIDTGAAPGIEVRADLINTGMLRGATGSVVYRATGGRDQLTVQAAALNDGQYEVRLATEVIGTLTVRAGTGTAQFDSAGLVGQPLGTSPTCKPIILARNGSAYLRSATDALAPGSCGRSTR